MNDRTKTRTRRTNNKLDIAIADATSKAIRDVGFSGLRLRDIMERGNISSPVLSNRYESVDDLIDRYVRKYDYWLNNTVGIDPLGITDQMEYYLEAAEKLINSYYNNKEIQRLHIWEMSDDNPTTRRTANMREAETARLIHFFEEKFKHSEIDVAAVTAIIIGGIYDIILRKDRSTFCNVDFSTRAGKKRLIAAATTIITMLYEKQERHSTVSEIAVNLLRNGVSVEIIARSTGLPVEAVENIKASL